MPAPQITDAEWEVMKAVWEESPVPIGEILKRVSRNHEWHRNTVQTLITRLVAKRALKATRKGHRCLYSPLISKDAGIEGATHSFLERVFGGAINPLVMHFIETKRISKKELQALAKLLDD